MSNSPSEPSEQATKRIPPIAVATIALAGVACGSGLIATAIAFRYLHSPALFKLSMLLGVTAAISALTCASIASRRIQSFGSTLRGERLVVTSRCLVILLFIWALLAPIFTPPQPHGGSGGTQVRNLRQIAQASLIYANDNRDVLPAVTVERDGTIRHATVHDVAKQLAQSGGLNDPSLWFSPVDKAVPKETFHLSGPIYDRERNRLNPAFAQQQVFSFDYATGLRAGHRPTTPIAWTRGLRLDGTWDSDGVYGTEGGHIAFIGGNVQFFPDLGAGESARLVGTDGQPTSNILDTLPPGSRIVGAGPASLNGYFKPAETKPSGSRSVERKPSPRFPQYERPRIQVARSSRETNAAKLLAIGTASRALFHQRGYPPAAISSQHEARFLTIHDIAVFLAAYAGLTDAQAWFSPIDPILPDSVKTLTNVLSPTTGKIDPDFAAQEIFSVDYVTGLTSDAPPTTPLAWTRGLQENGKWHRDGVGGNDGGHILFVDGNVWYYDTLFSKTVSLTALDGEPTSNILETLPRGARVVGAGPATLNGKGASK